MDYARECDARFVEQEGQFVCGTGTRTFREPRQAKGPWNSHKDKRGEQRSRFAKVTFGSYSHFDVTHSSFQVEKAHPQKQDDL